MSKKPNFKFKNTIRFPRILAQNVIGYRIIVHEEQEDGSYNKYILDEIDNPLYVNPIRHKEKFKFVPSGYYQLPDATYYTEDTPVEIYINGVMVENYHRTFIDSLNILKLNINAVTVSENDQIEIEFYLDEIEYIHNTDKKCLYKAEPVYEDKYLIGNHNILR